MTPAEAATDAPRPAAKSRPPVKLTKTRVEDLPSLAARYEQADSECRGLRIVVHPATKDRDGNDRPGVKTWSVRWSRHNQDYRLALGDFPTMTVEEARKAASAAKLKVYSGADPVAERREEKRIAKIGDDRIFRIAYARFLAEHLKKETKPKTWVEIDRVFRTLILPKFGDRVMADITRREVSDFATDIKMNGTGANGRKDGAPVIANNVIRYIRQLFNWAVGVGILEDNPTKGAKQVAKQKPRERALNDREIRWLWKAADRIAWPYGPMVQILLLTGARLREIAGMSRAEMQSEQQWTLPESRSKTGKALTVSLTPLMQDVLAKCPKIAGHKLLFARPNLRKASFAHGKLKLDAHMIEVAKEESNDPDSVTIAPFVIHDLRRTFRTGCAGLKPKLSPIAIELCMNHAQRGIAKTYDLHEYEDEKADVWRAWSAKIADLTG